MNINLDVIFDSIAAAQKMSKGFYVYALITTYFHSPPALQTQSIVQQPSSLVCQLKIGYRLITSRRPKNSKAAFKIDVCLPVNCHDSECALAYGALRARFVWITRNLLTRVDVLRPTVLTKSYSKMTARLEVIPKCPIAQRYLSLNRSCIPLF